MNARVVFLAAFIKHYRVPFCDLLNQALREDGIELRVLYGAPNSAHAARKDNVDLPPSYSRRVPSYWFADRVVYQSAWKEIAGADLVITPNENKLLLNPLLLALRAAGAKRGAFWGKGNIIPASIARQSEWLRYVTANAVDWWFPYTEQSAENLRLQGVRCGMRRLPAVGVLPQGNEATILRYSVSVKAFNVWVETLPIAPVESMNRAAASSSGNSEISTASYFPIVKYQA
jgi:hypothetical protein